MQHFLIKDLPESKVELGETDAFRSECLVIPETYFKLYHRISLLCIVTTIVIPATSETGFGSVFFIKMALVCLFAMNLLMTSILYRFKKSQTLEVEKPPREEVKKEQKAEIKKVKIVEKNINRATKQHTTNIVNDIFWFSCFAYYCIYLRNI